MSMGLDATLASLRREIARLQDVMSALRVTVIEDRPARGSVVLVDQLDNLITDLSSALEEADALAAQAQQSAQPNGTLESVRTALRDIHGLFNRFAASYAGELASHDHLAQLLDMGDERGHGWWEWSQEVKTAIERCGTPLTAVGVALVDCWSELCERVARNSVSVQATNIGQQITMREDQWDIAGKAS
jgi:hypothetical protein